MLEGRAIRILPMKLTNLAVVAGLFFATAGDLPAASLSVAGDANIFSAGHSGPPGGIGQGQSAPSVSFAAGTFSTLTFSIVTGSVTLDGFGHFNNADGIGSEPVMSGTTSFNGISGISAPHAGYLVGVFLTNIEPNDPPPPILDFTKLGTNFTTLSPLINQTFFIGDGLTGDGTGTMQQFMIPATATRLFLGISDAPGYLGNPGGFNDNAGSFNATFAMIPEPSVIALQLVGAAGFLAHRIRRRAKR
jgi:hypothetical protein